MKAIAASTIDRASARPKPLSESSDRLHRQLFPVVRRVLWTMLGRDREFDDITNDVFVRILQGLSHSRPDDIESWAARVTINTVHNTLRRRRHRQFAAWDPDSDPDVLVWHCDYDSRHVARRVAQVFSHMPQSEQALLEGRWSGATIDDLAAERACSGRTVKRRVQRALHRFERCVRKDPEVSSWLEQQGRGSSSERT